MERPQRTELNLIVGVTGASGALYARGLLRGLAQHTTGEVSLVVSPSALRVLSAEAGVEVASPAGYLKEALTGLEPLAEHGPKFRIESHTDIGARPASGSAHFDGMVVIPCSMKTLSAVAGGQSANLIERAADVCLKERRRLVLVPRETPLSLVHLRNMTAVTEAGAIVLPAAPGFYHRPKTLDDLANFIAGRVLSLFGVRHEMLRAWDPPVPEAD